MTALEIMDDFSTLEQPTVCEFSAQFLSGFQAPLFRRSADDGVPVLVVRMGDRDAVVPLGHLRSRLGIAETSPDGMMLIRIGEALDFVSKLRLGDPFPAEILTGTASWLPDAVHRHIADHHLRGRLIHWLRLVGAMGNRPLEEGDFDRAAHDPALSERLNAAFTQVAHQLVLPDALDAITLMEALADDMAFIEALRERLLLPMRQMARKLDAVAQTRRSDDSNSEMLILVRRLCRSALTQIGRRFSEIDRLTDDIIGSLSGGVAQQTLIRSSRDWLYRTQRSFSPVLEAWEAAPAQIDDEFWMRLSNTYRLLAPRFMTVQEWKQPSRRQSGVPGNRARMGW